MRRVIFFTILALLCLGDANAQNFRLDVNGFDFDTDSLDIRQYYVTPIVNVKNKGDYKCIMVGGSAFNYIPIIELGCNILSGDTGFFDIREWKSNYFAINLLNACFVNKRQNFTISGAIGISSNNYRFNEPITIGKGSDGVYPIPINSEIKKSKFTTGAIHIPLELTYRIPRVISFSAGGYMDMIINSHTKIKYAGGEKEKEHNYPVNFIQAGVTARVTIKNISLFCKYTPTPLFKEGRGPQFTQWSIGLGLF